MPKIELSKAERERAIASLQRYVEENLIEPIGNLQAGLMLDYFLEDLGPSIYNQAIRDAQGRVLQQVNDLDGDLYIDPGQYWSRLEARRRSKR